MAITTFLVIFTLTILRSFFSLHNAWDPTHERHRQVILQPFQQWIRQTVWYQAPLNTFGSILMFLPVGFLVVVYRYVGARSRDARPFLIAAIVGFLYSLGIEITQYVFGIGYSDINDLACSTLGVALAACVTKHLPRTTREEMCWRADCLSYGAHAGLIRRIG